MKKLTQTLKLIKQLKINKRDDLNKLLNHGFKKNKKRNSSCGVIYINERLKVVVKNSFEVNRPKLTGTKIFIETKFLKFKNNNENRYDRDSLLIQPLCKPFANWRLRDKAAKVLKEKVNLDKIFDIHSGNVMLYRGKPILVDW